MVLTTYTILIIKMLYCYEVFVYETMENSIVEL